MTGPPPVSAAEGRLLGSVECLLLAVLGAAGRSRVGVNHFTLRPEIRRDYPLNLSILLSGGKETNKDSPSNGE